MQLICIFVFADILMMWLISVNSFLKHASPGIPLRMALGKTWNGMEWFGMEWNGMEWIRLEWNGILSGTFSFHLH